VKSVFEIHLRLHNVVKGLSRSLDTEIHFTQYDKKNTSGKERPKLLFPIKAITETAARTTFPVLVENETTPRL